MPAAPFLTTNTPLLTPLTLQDLADLLQCLILRKQQPDAALQQLDELSGWHIEALRSLTKSIQDVRLRRDNDGIRAAIQQYDDALERYIPGVCGLSFTVLQVVVSRWVAQPPVPKRGAGIGHTKVSGECLWVCLAAAPHSIMYGVL
jgi:hypothetical protein